MTLMKLAAASCLSMAMATSTFAAPITLDFEFDGVTGTFYGLDDADGFGSATSYDLNFGGSSWTNVSSSLADYNSFTFSFGNLISVLFEDSALSLPARNSSFSLSFFIVENDAAEVFLEDIPNSTWDNPQGAVTFAINPVAAVPLPAAGLLLLSGIGGVAALKRRKKRAA